MVWIIDDSCDIDHKYLIILVMNDMTADSNDDHDRNDDDDYNDNDDDENYGNNDEDDYSNSFCTCSLNPGYSSKR